MTRSAIRFTLKKLECSKQAKKREKREKTKRQIQQQQQQKRSLEGCAKALDRLYLALNKLCNKLFYTELFSA